MGSGVSKRSNESLDAERKQVTVLFADVMGSMDLAEQHDPEDWRKIMQRFFSILADAVTEFEGTVDKFTGDGIMAVFGAPVAHEDHARRACYAALRMLDDVAGYAAELRREEGLNFSVRIGLNSGEVVAGAIGDAAGGDYTAIGHTVGLAQRMEAAGRARQGVPDRAHGGAGRRVPRPARTWASSRSRARAGRCASSSWPGSARRARGSTCSRERGFSRFVGRAEEMGALEEAPGAGRARRGQRGRRRRRARRRQEPPLPRVLPALPRGRAGGLRGAGPGPRQVDPLHAGAADAARLLRDRRA